MVCLPWCPSALAAMDLPTTCNRVLMDSSTALETLAEMEACVRKLMDPELHAEMSAASRKISHAGQARAHGSALLAMIRALDFGARA